MDKYFGFTGDTLKEIGIFETFDEAASAADFEYFFIATENDWKIIMKDMSLVLG